MKNCWNQLLKSLLFINALTGVWSGVLVETPGSSEDGDQEIVSNITNATNPISLCGDWTQLGVKCYKVIETLTTKTDAKYKCQQLDSSAYLVQIRSSEEQQRIFDMVQTYRSRHFPVVNGRGQKSVLKASNIWLGVTWGCRDQCSSTSSSRNHYNSWSTVTIAMDNAYRWEDNKIELSADFTNWDDYSPDSGATNLCIQMDLETGKWSDVKCSRKNLVVCEKDKKLTMDNLYAALENGYKSLVDRVKKMESGAVEMNFRQPQDAIPIDFLYTQLPNQSSPLDIWPDFNWKDITEEYSGLFFRAEGKGSQPFGQIQQQNYSRISHITAQGLELNELVPRYDKKYGPFKFETKPGNWTMVNTTNKQLHSISFYETNSDNIPVNTAVKIWKRTK